MCGIVSLFNGEKTFDTKLRDLMTNMLWIDTVRGFHSTGIIYETEGGVDYYKKAVPGYDFVELPLVGAVLQNLEKTRFFVGHNRAATLGKVNSQNAHPFEHGHIIGVHNGTLTNHRTLVDRENFDVDSEYLYYALSNTESKELFPKVNGSFNLIWHDDRDNTVHICKNKDRPYSFLKIKGKDYLIGASEKVMAKWLINRHGYQIEYAWSPKDDYEYIFEMDGDITKPAKKIIHEPFKHQQSFYPPQNHDKWNKNKNLPVPIHEREPTGEDKNHLLFFFDTIIANQKIAGATDTFTLHGETLGEKGHPGTEVVVYNAYRHELERDQWYTGSGRWIGSQGGYWLIDRMSIKEFDDEDWAQYAQEQNDKEDSQLKEVPSADSSGIALLTCVSCETAAPEDVVVKIKDTDAELMCLECCQAHNVEVHEVEKEDQWKLITDEAY